MPTNYFPNGYQIIGALTFSASLTEAITRLSSGEVIWVNQPGDPDQTTEMMRWDPLTGQLRMQGIDGENVSFIIPRFTVATLPTAGVAGRMAYTTDDNLFRLDNGTSWLQVSPIAIPLAVASGGTGSTTAAGARTNLGVPSNAEAILDTIFDAKGDLLVATAADTPARKAVGTDGEVLTADSSAAEGVAYAPVGVPTGVYVPFAGAAVPTGWLLCDGQAVSRSTFATLFAEIASTYGDGDGSTTFNVPNLKGRIPVGLDAAQTEFDALAETGGAKTHTLTAAEMPVHSHAYTAPANSTWWQNGGSFNGTISGTTTGSTTGSAGSGDAHNNLQPYIVCNYIIKT